MKNSTLVVCLFLISFVSLRAERTAAPFGVNNIVLKNFQAIQVTGGAKIIWEFTSEERDVTCKLEKSIDGINFGVLYTIHLTSTRQQALHSFIDTELPAKVFYRLRVTKESYIPYISPIVSLTATRDETGPVQNPGMSNSVFGKIASDEAVVHVRILDMRGQSKLQQRGRGTELDRNFRPAFGRLPSGYYVLRVQDEQNNILLNRFIYKF
ncbi:MAG TPA: hypothetical protein VD993_03630 [Chitinophagaceae bacterium]|nr:hypothetical protein [Chitinophagaceae bacterium]